MTQFSAISLTRALNLLIPVVCISLSSLAYANESTSEKPGYQKMLTILQNNDKVIPTAPDVHPLHTVYNREAVIPPQCYTKTEGKYNPCYVCHQDGIEGRENVMNDAGLQAAYSFSDTGLTNHWKNLFEDRSQRVNDISDQEIIKWVNQDNYSALAERLKAADYKGWIPDLANLQQGAAAFDEQGFAKDNSHWVSFNYKPLPSTFWPTNGSTDDVMIRLPEKYRSNDKGEYSADVYKANLAILEALIKGVPSISSLPIDERDVGTDLNGDKKLGNINYVNQVSNFVGAAQDEYLELSLYPANTEFLHTVRYLGFNKDGVIQPSTRMKEVRYMRKWRFYNKHVYARKYEIEAFEKEAGNLPGYHNVGDHGLDNGNGWAIRGFIEDKKGHLRANTFEENFFCMGCHNSIGSTIDKTFSFARKVDGQQGWGYINLKGMPDAPNIGETQGEIITYLKRVGGGSEFRNNDEMKQRWFNANGSLNHTALAQAKDVYDLITPSRERALSLNKSYKVIVEDQDFIFGRDATATPPVNVYKEVDNEKAPTLPASRVFKWDIRLNWSPAVQTETAMQK